MSRKPNAAKQRWPLPAIYAVLALVTCAVYWPTLGNDFVNYDDGDYVLGNQHVQSGINKASLGWAFTTVHASNWHPLTWISHELDCQLYGLKPEGPHLTNLFFHIANALLLFAVMRKMTGALWRSAFVAALFALHPTHVESVAWISERKDVLSAFFWLLTMLAYASYAKGLEVRNSGYKVCYALSLVCFVLGLMSKPMVVTLPFVLLLLDYWPLGRIYDLRFAIHESKNEKPRRSEAESKTPVANGWRRALIEKIPFFLLAGASSVVTFVAQRKGGAVATLGGMPIGARIANAVVSYFRYIGKLFWPDHLSVLYPMPPSWPVTLIIVSAVFLAGVSALAIWQARQRPYLFTGWFWFAGTLVPVIGIVQVGVQSMADRYLYLPAIGLFIAAAWGVAELLVKWPKRREAVAGGAVILLIGCAAVTWEQVQYWQDGESLFRRTVQVTKNNYLAYNNLGFFLENHGKPDEAVEDYRKSVEINPSYEEARNNLGHILTTQGKYEEAIIHLREALKIKPDLVEARNNLGNALGDMGKQDEAIEQYELALHYKSDDVDAHNNLGVARAMQGRVAEAEQLLREAVRVKPSDAGAHSNLGNVLAMQHKLDEAVEEYGIALKLNPADSQAHFNLGNVLLEQRKLAEAQVEYEAAIKLKPDNADAQYRWGVLLAAEGKREEAVAHFREALRLNPRNIEAQKRIDALLSGK